MTDRILKCFYRVYNTLGHGFLEKVYRNAMAIELEQMGLAVQQEEKIQVIYSGIVVGEYFADLIVDGQAILD